MGFKLQYPNAKDKIDPLTGDTIKVKKAGFVEKIGRHALIQTEFLFGEKFHLKRFSFEYGWMIYSAAGSQHGITFSIPIGEK